MQVNIGALRVAFAMSGMLIAASCSQLYSDRIDLAAEEHAIREVNAQWMEAFQSHDASGEAAVFASDGVEYRPHQEPIIGPAAIEAFDAQFFADNPSLAVSWSTDEIEIAASGDLAIQTGEFQATGIGPGADLEDYGRILTVWKKEDGEWKVAHAMVESTMPLASAVPEN